MLKSGKLAIGLGIVGGLAATRLFLRKKFVLSGKTVLINGGSRGLGLVLAREFAQEGARVAITARDREELDRAAKDLQKIGPKVLAIECDATMREEAERAVAHVIQHFGSIDVLVYFVSFVV